MAADPHVISALQDKLYDLRQAIVTYEEHLERTRQELSVVTAALVLFQQDDGRVMSTNPANIRNLFKRGELLTLARKALGEAPEGLGTRELAVSCLLARGYKGDDPVLVRAMVGLLSNTLKKAARHGGIVRIDLGQRRIAWRID